MMNYIIKQKDVDTAIFGCDTKKRSRKILKHQKEIDKRLGIHTVYIIEKN